jgi:hypothetical protein
MKLITASMLVAAALLSACTYSQSELNDELSIGNGDGRRDSYKPAAFSQAPVRSEPESKTPPAPSVVAIDRNNWDVLRVEVPNDRVAHQPIYTNSLYANNDVARNRGLYPTASSANQLKATSSEDAQILEAAEAPFAAAADIILFIPRAFMDAPWDPVRTGFQPYRRAPNPRASVSPVLTVPKPPERTGKPGIVDPAAAPVQVPIGEYLPAGQSAGTPQPR